MTTSTLSCNLSEEMQKKLAACEQEVRNRCRALSSELVSYLALQSASLCLMITSLHTGSAFVDCRLYRNRV